MVPAICSQSSNVARKKIPEINPSPTGHSYVASALNAVRADPWLKVRIAVVLVAKSSAALKPGKNFRKPKRDAMLAVVTILGSNLIKANQLFHTIGGVKKWWIGRMNYWLAGILGKSCTLLYSPPRPRIVNFRAGPITKAGEIAWK